MEENTQVPEKVAALFLMAQRIAEKTPDFFRTKGPGVGDRASGEFMKRLRKGAKSLFGADYSEKKVSPATNFTLDFYFPQDAAAVEIALSLHQPRTEYELDLFKCLLAREAGSVIERLFFITKPGALSRQNAPGQRAIADFVKRHFGLQIDVLELIPNSGWTDTLVEKRPIGGA